jgi:ATP-dependent Lon protease
MEKLDLLLAMLSKPDWDSAFEHALNRTPWEVVKSRGQSTTAVLRHAPNRASMREDLADIAEELFAAKKIVPALAWLMMAATPRKPRTLLKVVPQLSWAVSRIPADKVKLREVLTTRLEAWVFAAAGVHTDSIFDMFEIARGLDAQHRRDSRTNVPEPEPDDEEETMTPVQKVFGEAKNPWATPSTVPGMVVLQHKDSTPLTKDQVHLRHLAGARLPLVTAQGIEARIRPTLLAEFPHAPREIDLLLQDLREGEPVRIRPVLLVAPPGVGKSRLMQRLYVDLLGLPAYRMDGAGSADGQFSGSPKAWGNTQPSAPVRAIAYTRTANPLLALDEVDKAASGRSNGNLWDALGGFTDRITAATYRDVSLDAPVDLSWVNFVMTANDDRLLPEQLRDRLRIVRIPVPTLAHLPALAAQVLREMEREAGDQPGWLEDLEADELAIAGRAWAASRFSMRKLLKIVAATVAARREHPAPLMRH